MDDELKQIAKMIQAQNLGQVVSDENTDELDVEDYADMGAPRPENINEPKKTKFPSVSEYIGKMNNKLETDDNFVAPVTTREVYPSKEQLSSRDKAFNSIKGSLADPNANSIANLERLRKHYGPK